MNNKFSELYNKGYSVQKINQIFKTEDTKVKERLIKINKETETSTYRDIRIAYKQLSNRNSVLASTLNTGRHFVESTKIKLFSKGSTIW